MNDDDTDNDFIDDLYAHSAKEIPPALLDQAILKHALDHVHKDNFFQRLQLQRVFSVAAVLVLSVYIVFDVGEQRLGIEGFLRTEEKIRFESPAFYEESTGPTEEQRLKVEKSKVKKTMDAPAYESTAAPDDLRKSGLKKEQSIAIYSFQSEQVKDKGVIVSVETMIEEIEKLIAADKLEDAKKAYQELSAHYPEYRVPSRIIKALK
jgi:hypothetical protein